MTKETYVIRLFNSLGEPSGDLVKPNGESYKSLVAAKRVRDKVNAGGYPALIAYHAIIIKGFWNS